MHILCYTSQTDFIGTTVSSSLLRSTTLFDYLRNFLGYDIKKVECVETHQRFIEGSDQLELDFTN